MGEGEEVKVKNWAMSVPLTRNAWNALLQVRAGHKEVIRQYIVRSGFSVSDEA